MADAYFTTKGNGWFTPTDFARGPWDAHACHAGPPTGLMVRAVEGLVPHHRLTRITVELIRPIPMAGFRVQAEVRKPGRSVTHTEAEIYDDDHFYARAYALHTRVGGGIRPEGTTTAEADFSKSKPGPFTIGRPLHDLPGFVDSVECRVPVDDDADPSGPQTLWMRTIVPILPAEEPSPFQKITPLADCGNGISYHGDLGEYTFLNTDLTISLHREPIGDWFGSRVESHWQETGIGLADAKLFDLHGPVGRATQSLIIERF